MLSVASERPGPAPSGPKDKFPRLQAATVGGPHVMAASRVGASPPLRVWSQIRRGETGQGVSTPSNAQLPRLAESKRPGVQAWHWATPERVEPHQRRPSLSALAAVAASWTVCPSLAPPAGEAPPRLRPGSAPGSVPGGRMRPSATLGHKTVTKFVIFVGCDIHWAGQPCAGSPCVGTPWSLSLPFRPMVPVLSSSSDNVIGSKGLCVAASQTVQLNRWYTSTQNVRCFPRYCCFNSWNWQQFGSYFHSFQPQRWFRAVLRPHSRHPRWQPRFQAPLHKGFG